MATRPVSRHNSAHQAASYRKWQIKIFSATWLAYVGYYFCRKAFYVVKIDLSVAMDLTAIDLANLGTAYLISYMVGQFSSAYFGKRLGPKLLLLTGMGLSIICNFVFGFSNSFWTLMLFLSINGLAQGTGWPGCIGSLAFWFKRKQRGSILGVWSTCYQIGSVMATSFAAFLLGHYGWHWSFFGASTVMLLIWFVVFFVHPNKPLDVGLEPIQDEDDIIEDDSDEGYGWDRNVIVTILMMGMIYFCIKFLRYALWSWTPAFLRLNFGLTGENSGYLSTVFDLCGFAGVLFSGFLSDRLFKGRRSLLSLIMLALMALSFILMYKLGSANLFYFTVSLGLAGFMLYGPDSLLSGVGAIDVGSQKGALAAAGIINGIGSIGPLFQEQIIGWMYEKLDRDLVPILVMLVIIALTGTILTFILWLRSRSGKANV